LPSFSASPKRRGERRRPRVLFPDRHFQKKREEKKEGEGKKGKCRKTIVSYGPGRRGKEGRGGEMGEKGGEGRMLASRSSCKGQLKKKKEKGNGENMTFKGSLLKDRGAGRKEKEEGKKSRREKNRISFLYLITGERVIRQNARWCSAEKGKERGKKKRKDAGKGNIFGVFPSRETRRKKRDATTVVALTLDDNDKQRGKKARLLLT